MLSIDTNEKGWQEKLHWPKEVKISGFIPYCDFKYVIRMYVEYSFLDLSQAELAPDQHATAGYSGHGGYSKVTKEEDEEYILLSNVAAIRLVLPDNIKRRTLNALIREGRAWYLRDKRKWYHLEVSPNNKLFSMKDGAIYNKKGDKLIFENDLPLPEMATCPECGEEYIKSSFITEGLTGRQISIRSACDLDLYDCYQCGKYYPRQNLQLYGYYGGPMYCCAKCGGDPENDEENKKSQ